MRTTQKMKTTARKLLRFYLDERRDLRRTGNHQPLSCVAKPDRLVFTTNALPLQALCNIPGYRANKPEQLWKHLYRFVTRIRGTGSIREVVVESAPNVGWLPRYRVTVIPRDETGLLFDDLRFILELIPHFKIVLVEIAFDFPIRSFVDPSYVRRHGLFGKTWLRAGANELYERCGSTRGSKLVRWYVKFEVSQFRIELQLHARFLRQHGINHTSDFPKLAAILPVRHIHFASLNEAKLRKHLLRTVPSANRRADIFRAVATRKKSLWATLRYLRQNARLTNVRRLLTPRVSINTLVRNSLEDWARQWPSAPNRLNPPASEPASRAITKRKSAKADFNSRSK
jgi:hypothetical protein